MAAADTAGLQGIVAQVSAVDMHIVAERAWHTVGTVFEAVACTADMVCTAQRSADIALAAVIMAASGMERDGVIGAAGGGPTASALAGRQARSVTCGFADKTPCASVTLPPAQAAWFTPEADGCSPGLGF